MEATLIKSDYELERGKPMPSKLHGYIQNRIGFLLTRDYENLYTVFTELTIKGAEKDLVPDIALYFNKDINLEEEEIRMEKAPVAVVEILSPSQSLSELTKKCKKYFEIGVKSYWLVLPELRTIYVFNEPTDHTVFTKEEMLQDNALNVTMDFKALFKTKVG